MATKTTPTPTEIHGAAKQAVDQWQTELAAAREQVEKLDAETPATTAEARKTATALASAREYAVKCEHSLTAAIERQQEAARAIVRAEALELQPEIDKLQEKLATHDTKTAQLKQALTAHTAQGSQITGPLRDLQNRQKVLDAAAEGIDPITLVGSAHDLPPSLRIGGVLPSPALVEQAAAEEAERVAEEERRARLAPDQKRVEQACQTLGADYVPDVWEAYHRPDTSRVRHWLDAHRARHAKARQRALDAGQMPPADLPEEHLDAFRVIVELCGLDAGIDVVRALERTTGTTAA